MTPSNLCSCIKLTQISRADPDGEKVSAGLWKIQHLSHKIPAHIHTLNGLRRLQLNGQKYSVLSTVWTAKSISEVCVEIRKRQWLQENGEDWPKCIGFQLESLFVAHYGQLPPGSQW